MLFWEVVYPAGETADGSLPGEPVEGNVNRFPAADVQKVGRNEYGTASAAVNGRNYPRINGLW
ncbi:MAG: hypothetical protein JWO38_3003 [Gemmataceae bacterium]|nr:hypothetical protein [Gemmataceae bacterium]